MRKINTQHIPKMAKGPMSTDLTALLSRIFGGIYQYIQGIIGPRANG